MTRNRLQCLAAAVLVLGCAVAAAQGQAGKGEPPKPEAPKAETPKPEDAKPQAAAPATAPTSSDPVNVRAFGAKGDGTADDTGAFRAAMAAVAARGGVVTVPAGDYLIRTHLDVPPGVTLEGTWRAPTAKAPKLGATLLAVEGAGAEAGTPFITLGTSATLKGIAVLYPEQKPDSITPYPWCVSAGGENVSIVDCLLINPFQGVDLASKPSGRHYVRNLSGQPLRRGIFVDKCFDVGRIENVHFGTFWNWDEKVQAFQTQNGEAFVFARSDVQYVTNTFCYGYRVGFRFIKSADGAANANLSGVGVEASHVAVWVEATQGQALLVTNGQFVSFTGDKPAHVVVGEGHAAVLQFQNCAFWGLAHQVARINGTGTVSFNNCNFVEWTNGVPAIDLSGGDLIVNGCVFQKAFPQAVLQGKAQSAVISSNRLAGPLSVENPAKAVLQAGTNVEKKPPP